MEARQNDYLLLPGEEIGAVERAVGVALDDAALGKGFECWRGIVGGEGEKWRGRKGDIVPWNEQKDKERQRN